MPHPSITSRAMLSPAFAVRTSTVAPNRPAFVSALRKTRTSISSAQDASSIQGAARHTHHEEVDVGNPDMQRRMILAGGLLVAVAPHTGFISTPAQGPGGTMGWSSSGTVARAATVLGEPVTDPRLILRSSLLPEGSTIPQPFLDLDNALRAIGSSTAKRSAAGSRSIPQAVELTDSKDSQAMIEASLRKARNTASKGQDVILSSLPASSRSDARKLLSKLLDGLSSWEATPQSANPETIESLKSDLLNLSGQLQALLVNDFSSVPAEYASLPQLRGRAVAEIKIKDAKMPGEKHTLTVVLDGLNAPVTAGNFIDLCQKGFYNNMEIQRADGFVVQTGDKGSESAARAKIPMEVRYQDELEPTYGATKEELGLMRKQVVLPFNALGTLAMARGDFDANSADTQFFFLNKESEVTPSGANVLDGNYAVFGYVVYNQEVLPTLKVGDVIESIQVTYGADKLKSAA